MGRGYNVLRSFCRHPAERQVMLVEAAIFLLLARLALKILPFRCLMWYFKRQNKLTEIKGSERERFRKEVSGVIERVANYLPGNTVCFPRGIAAQAMLRRRRIGTTLFYGAATLSERGITSHVWVKDGEEGVVGHNVAGDYHVLARYPEIR